MSNLTHMKHARQLLRALSVKPRNYPTSTKVCYCINQQRPLHILQSVPQPRYLSVATTQWKYNKKDVDSDSDNEDETEFKDERDSKVVKTKVNSLRADLLLKAGLGIARNKVENIFYESRIRVNGKKLAKKSVQLHEGDEIDVIRGFSQTNPSHLVVSRVVILAATEREEGLSVQLRRYKGLLVENYTGANAYKSSAVSNH